MVRSHVEQVNEEQKANIYMNEECKTNIAKEKWMSGEKEKDQESQGSQWTLTLRN